MRNIPILCYHRVHRDDDPHMPAAVPGQSCGHVTLSRFHEQMKVLAQQDFTIVTHRQLMQWRCDQKDLPAGNVAAIDFDDNRLNVFENALPVMDEYGFTGTVFAISRLAQGNLPAMQTYPAMQWHHLAQLAERGWTIGAHTATHTRLGDLSQEKDGLNRVESEFVESNEAFERYLAFGSVHFAYPQGDWNEPVEAIVRRYYRTARHWQNSEKLCFNHDKTDPYRLQAIHVTMHLPQSRFLEVLDKASENHMA